MPSVEVLVYVLTGTMTLVTALGGMLWAMLRAETRDQSESLKKKADTERLHEAEARWSSELTAVKVANEKLIENLDRRHERDLDQMSARLTEQIKTTEVNILAQLRLIAQTVNRTN